MQIIPQTNSVWNLKQSVPYVIRVELQIIPQTNSVWNTLHGHAINLTKCSCKLYHKPTRFETPIHIFRGGVMGCKLYHKPTRFETDYVCAFGSDKKKLQIIPQTNSVWNFYVWIVCKLTEHVANYTTNQLGLKLCNCRCDISYYYVANYTTNQLGLKLKSCFSIKFRIKSCKLYHKPTRFETHTISNYHGLNQVANYTTNQLGLKLQFYQSYPLQFWLQIIPQTNSVWNAGICVGLSIL